MTDSYYIRRAVPGEEQMVREMVIRVKQEMPAEQQIWFSIDNLDEELRDFRQEKVLCYLAMERLESENGNGEELSAENRKDIPAGLFFLEIPGLSEHNLGHHVGFSEEELKKVVHMDTAVVLPEHRGHGLQSRLMEFPEAELKAAGYTHLMGTVHPENQYSHRSFEKIGYRLVWSGLKYGGKPRDLMEKDL